jgi:hypothetical protein
VPDTPASPAPDRPDAEPEQRRAQVGAALRQLGPRWWLTCSATGLLLLGCLGWLLADEVLALLGVSAPPWLKYLSGGVIIGAGVLLILLTSLPGWSRTRPPDPPRHK